MVYCLTENFKPNIDNSLTTHSIGKVIRWKQEEGWLSLKMCNVEEKREVRTSTRGS